MPVDCEIILEHEGPVSIDALRETIALIGEASEEAAIRLLHSAIFADLALPNDFIEKAEAVARAESAHAFWLESVEPGSSRFKGAIGGFILRVLLLTISGTASKVAFDVIQDTQTYQTIQPRLVQMVDQQTNLFVEYLRAKAGERKPDMQLTLRIEKTADRVRIYVTPSPKQREYISLG